MQSNNCFSFLDDLVDNSGTNPVFSSVCKPSHTSLYTKWNSFIIDLKLNLINCLLDCCYRISSSNKIICDKFEQIKPMMLRNGHPKHGLNKCIREFFYRKFAVKPLLSKKKHSTFKKIFIHLPFWGALSLQIRNEQKALLHKYMDDKTSVYIVNTLSKIEKNFRFKDRRPLIMRSGIVYKLTCS